MIGWVTEVIGYFIRSKPQVCYLIALKRKCILLKKTVIDVKLCWIYNKKVDIDKKHFLLLSNEETYLWLISLCLVFEFYHKP